MQKPRLISMAANHIGDGGISDLEIHDKTLSCGVHAVLSPQNSFLVYGVQRGKKAEEWTVQHLHEVTPKSSLYNQYVRKLVNESQSVFISLHRAARNFQDGRKNIEIAKISQKYRSILLACIEEIDSAVGLTKDEELEELLQMFSNIELLWHLLQSLIIDIHSGARPLYKLLNWIQWHFVLAETKNEEIIQSEEPFSHPEYWDTIIQFLLQGKVSSVRSLLALHKKSQREDFMSLDELLKKMPVYDMSSSGMSLNEFRIRWKHWQEECKSRLGRGDFSFDHGLESVCKVLCGDPEILTQNSNLCVNWYHLMISVLLYTDPCITLPALGDMAREYYNSASSNSYYKLSVLDSIILAAMELDIKNVINLACSFNDGWWFALHMMDLLALGGYIDSEQQKDYVFNFQNFLLMNYADTLMSHSSLWQVGVNYLDFHNNGRELQELYLERIPLKTENKARKVIYLAKKRNMENLVRTVANVMTSKAMANGKLGTALTWVAHSKDARFADELADRWLKDYVDRRKLEGLDILKSMGSCMLVSDKLTFVGKYCEFHKLYVDREYKTAASLLLSLIASGIAPPEFQIIMLFDALPLLETSELIFSKRDTYQLMKCLEEAVLHITDKEPSHSDNESLIRLALVRNLAKCFVLEPGDSESDDDL